MSRIIINNESMKSDAEVISHVLGVIKKGYVSKDGTSYCLGTGVAGLWIRAKKRDRG